MVYISIRVLTYCVVANTANRERSQKVMSKHSSSNINKTFDQSCLFFKVFKM